MQCFITVEAQVVRSSCSTPCPILYTLGGIVICEHGMFRVMGKPYMREPLKVDNCVICCVPSHASHTPIEISWESVRDSRLPRCQGESPFKMLPANGAIAA